MLDGDGVGKNNLNRSIAREVVVTDTKKDKAPVPGVPKDSAETADKAPKPEPEDNAEDLPREDPAASGPGFDEDRR